MAHIGNRKHAQEIHEWFRSSGWDKNNPPEGWEVLGSGSFRYAFRHIETNVVYKCERRTDGECYGSKAELRIAQSLRKNKTFNKVRIPKTSGFRFGEFIVLAMEVVMGSRISQVQADQHEDALFELFGIGFYDMHEYNFFIDTDGYAVPIDMASVVRPGMGDLRTLHGTSIYDRERAKRWGEPWTE